MYIIIIFFILGFFLLIKGADILIDGSSSIAKRFGVSGFFIGITIVAFGTSAPEMVISLLASVKHISAIALGNIIGANISNTLLVLGISAIITPLLIKRATINKEVPFSLLAVLAVGILANDFLIDGLEPSGLSRIDGLILILFFVIFIYYTFGISRPDDNIFQKTASEIKISSKNGVKELNVWLSFLMIFVGLVGLAVGGHFIVNNAVKLARILNISEAMIGLTIVAIGTTLPELAASVTAARKGFSNIAVGNVIGSNIFNFLWILGLSSVITPIGFNSALNSDLLYLILVTILVLFLIYFGRKNILGRWEGGILLFLYILYLTFVIMRG